MHQQSKKESQLELHMYCDQQSSENIDKWGSERVHREEAQELGIDQLPMEDSVLNKILRSNNPRTTSPHYSLHESSSEDTLESVLKKERGVNSLCQQLHPHQQASS